MRSRSQAYKAVVSSTFEDLKDHRAYVIRLLRKAGFFVDAMEDWAADSDEPKKFSQDRLAGCALCVLLVAFRRGHVPDGETPLVCGKVDESSVSQCFVSLNMDLPKRVIVSRKGIDPVAAST